MKKKTVKLYLEKKRQYKWVNYKIITAGVGKVGHECLQKWAGLVKSVSMSEQDLTRVSAGVGKLGQECPQVSAGWVKSVCMCGQVG